MHAGVLTVVVTGTWKKINLTLSLFQLKQHLVVFVWKIKSDSVFVGAELMGHRDRPGSALCYCSIWSLIHYFICSLVYGKMHFPCSCPLQCGLGVTDLCRVSTAWERCWIPLLVLPHLLVSMRHFFFHLLGSWANEDLKVCVSGCEMS